MAVVDVCNMNGEKVSEIVLADSVFARPVKTAVLHEVVTMQLANRRSGTACVKNRSDIAASGKKLYRQKGTGRARAGDRRSPLRRGGGVIFGPHPRSYEYRVPKKVRRQALCMALSSKLAENCLRVVDHMELPSAKTREFMKVMGSLCAANALIVTEKEEKNLTLSARNVAGVKVLCSAGLNVYDVLKYNQLILLAPAVKDIERRLSA